MLALTCRQIGSAGQAACSRRQVDAGFLPWSIACCSPILYVMDFFGLREEAG